MPFIGCYLLQSKNEQAKGKTYIGFTVNPKRRIRQHNGEITNGAFKTKKWRPWDMVLVVYGFATQTSALQFEWAWQHPEKSLDVRDAAARVGRKARYGVSGKVLLLMEILNSSPWKYHPLSVMFLSGEHARLQAGSRPPPPHVSVRVASLDDLSCDSDDDDALEVDEDEQGDEFGIQGMNIAGESSVSLGGRPLETERGGGGDGGGILSVYLTSADDSEYIERRIPAAEEIIEYSQMSISTSEYAPRESEQAPPGDEELGTDNGSKPAKKKRSTATLCVLCSRAATRTWAVCSGCGARTHVECLAEHFLGNSSQGANADLIGTNASSSGGMAQRTTLPTGGACSACGQRTTWNDVLKGIGNVGWGGRKRPQQSAAATEGGQPSAPAAAGQRAAKTTKAKGRGKKKEKESKSAVVVNTAQVLAGNEFVIGDGGGGGGGGGSNGYGGRLELEEQPRPNEYENEYEIDAAQQPWEDYSCPSPEGSEAGGGYEMSCAPSPGACDSSDNEMAVSPSPGVPVPVGDTENNNDSRNVVDLVSPAPLAQRLAQRGGVVALPATPEVIDLLDDE